ncbi:hypothetical protein LEMLEM_LOCUS7076 [Lemmus lemmus]
MIMKTRKKKKEEEEEKRKKRKERKENKKEEGKKDEEEEEEGKEGKGKKKKRRRRTRRRKRRRRKKRRRKRRRRRRRKRSPATAAAAAIALAGVIAGCFARGARTKVGEPGTQGAFAPPAAPRPGPTRSAHWAPVALQRIHLRTPQHRRSRGWEDDTLSLGAITLIRLFARICLSKRCGKTSS